MKRLRLIRHSQRETLPASSLSSSNRFAALDSDTVLRQSEADVVPSHVLGQSAGSNRVVDVVHMGTPGQSSGTESVKFLAEDDSSHSGDEESRGSHPSSNQIYGRS